jgi:two-component system OmpR family response regulator
MRVLIVEDDVKLAALIRRGLAAQGIAADLVHGAEEALVRTDATSYDVVVLDVMLPGRDGFAICRELRDRRNWTGVLMLTARGAVDDRVAGLNAGADDYLVKPFSFVELVARVRALARRGATERPVMLQVGDLRLDRSRLQVWRGETAVDLSSKEFALLEALMLRPGQVLSRFELLEQAWPYDYENRSNVVEVYVRYLREKIDRPFHRKSIQTIRGAGYKLCAD